MLIARNALLQGQRILRINTFKVQKVGLYRPQLAFVIGVTRYCMERFRPPKSTITVLLVEIKVHFRPFPRCYLR